MENIILIIVLYFIGTLVSDKANRNKRKKRKNHDKVGNSESNFDIPSLNRDIPQIENALKSENKPAQNEAYQKAETQNLKPDAKTNIASDKPVVLTKDNVRTGIILAEILNKPKAYRRFR